MVVVASVLIGGDFDRLTLNPRRQEIALQLLDRQEDERREYHFGR